MGHPQTLQPILKTVQASTTDTATDNSGNLNGATGSLPLFPATIMLVVDVTAASGTSPTLDITFETSFDGATTWVIHSAFTQITGTTQLVARFRNWAGAGDAAIEGTESAAGTFINAPYHADHRFLYTIGGTNPSFTFGIYSISLAAF